MHLSLISCPDFSTISLLIAPSISPLFRPFSNCTPTLQTWLTYRAFTFWSEKQGKQIIGTPSLILSNVEFQPLWVQNAPTAGWANTSCWGAHFTMCPLPPMVSRNPLGSGSSHSEPRMNPGRTTHKKGCLLLASPQAISIKSVSSNPAMLPKLT